LLDVPAPRVEVADEGYALLDKLSCPKCKRNWPEGTVVCVDCGWNFEKGSGMRTKFDVRPRGLPKWVSAFGVVQYPTLCRTPKGKLVLTTRRKLFALIPLSARKVELKRYSRLVTNGDFVDDDGSAYVYEVFLEGVKAKRVLLYRGTNEECFHETIDTLRDVAGLEVTRG
jgi:hypothetical protein